MTPAYSSKSKATRAARAALGETALFTTDKTAAGWTWSPMAAPAAPEAPEPAQLSPGLAAAGLAEAMGGPLAVEAVAEDRAKADPLVVDGFRHGNMTRANDARRALVGRQRASREGFPKAGKVHVTPSREA